MALPQPDESFLVWGIALLTTLVIFLVYFLRFRRRVRRDRERKETAAQLGIDRPVAQFPYVDAGRCIGCGACVAACPEGDVLGIVGGTAVVVNGLRCVGHARCEVVCPVGAIEVGLGDLKGRSDIPLLDDELQTSLPGVYIAGELGGLALLKNAVLQGSRVAAHVARQVAAGGATPVDALDLVIVGAGPAGLAAGVVAAARRLSFALVEKERDLGGSLLHYPRRKMVLTQPVELPPWGRLEGGEHQKEDLLEMFEGMVRDCAFDIRFATPLVGLRRDGDLLRVLVPGDGIACRNVVLALGRRGSPRKLGVPGEELPKVMYRLIDAESYRGQRILVVGGGDSAVEAAVGLARQHSNEITLSYRRESLVRIKRKNQEAFEKLATRGRVRPLFSSRVLAIERGHVRLELAGGEPLDLANDYVFVFAGGVPPFPLLAGMGIRFGGGNEEAEEAGSSRLVESVRAHSAAGGGVP